MSRKPYDIDANVCENRRRVLSTEDKKHEGVHFTKYKKRVRHKLRSVLMFGHHRTASILMRGKHTAYSISSGHLTDALSILWPIQLHESYEKRLNMLNKYGCSNKARIKWYTYTIFRIDIDQCIFIGSSNPVYLLFKWHPRTFIKVPIPRMGWLLEIWRLFSNNFSPNQSFIIPFNETSKLFLSIKPCVFIKICLCY